MRIKTTKHDRRFSELIRLRDDVCQMCGRAGRTECSHVYSRRHKSIRWDTRNAFAACHQCHRHWHSNPLLSHEWLEATIGEKQVTMLRLMANTTSKAPTKAVLDLIYSEMKEEIEYLKSIPAEERQNLQFRYRYRVAV